jgi:LysM repeat protein
MKEDTNQIFNICPYLGQRTDPATALSYPSVLNRCYHSKVVATIHHEHQEQYCLTSGYPNCHEYTKDPDAALPGVHPSSSGDRSQKQPGNRKWIPGMIVLGIVVITLGIIIAWLFITRGQTINGSLLNPALNATFIEPSTQFTPTSRSPMATPSRLPTFTTTATLRPLFGLETPLGIDQKFEVHPVQTGESLELIASKHGTSVEALRAVNYRLPSPLLTDWKIVVPLNILDTQGLPAFEVYSVVEEISLADLVLRLSVDLEQFIRYNDIAADFIPRIGDWLLVPRSATATP